MKNGRFFSLDISARIYHTTSGQNSDFMEESVKDLNFDEKYRLWELLEEQIAQAEEEMLEQDPSVQAEIRTACEEYRSGDYETI